MDGASADASTPYGKAGRCLGNIAVEPATQTTIRLRVTVTAVLAAVTLGLIILMGQNLNLQRSVALERSRVPVAAADRSSTGTVG